MSYKRVLRLGSSVLLCMFALWTMLASSREEATSEPQVSGVRGGGEIRFCSLNLARYGAPLDGQRWQTQTSQLQALLERIIQAKCAVVALQEVFGPTESESNRILSRFGQDLSGASGRPFGFVIGQASHDQIRNGMLYRTDIFDLREQQSLPADAVPQIDTLGPPTRFTRSPLALVLRYRPDPSREFLVVNLHLKSKSTGWKDPSGMNWELVRMEMAEAVRLWALRLEAQHRKGIHVVIMGDRNSDEFSASTDVLRGARALEDFRSGAVCSVTKDLTPLCHPNGSRPPSFVGLLSLKGSMNPQVEQGTYSYRGDLEIIDEILVEAGDLPLFADSSGRPFVGVEGTFNRGSDHKLVWAEINW